MSAFEKLKAAIAKTQAPAGGFVDPMADKYWKLEGDKSGNGSAVIRFLPGKTEEDIPFVKTYSHGFKNSAGRWFIEQCPTTIGEQCPCCEANGPLWNSGVEKDKEIVRERKRKVGHVSNILVVSDPKNPDNEGKVFLFKYGQKIFDKVVGAMTPEFEDEKAINPFDLKEGANFKFKMRRVEGYANYDKSAFDAIEALNDKEQKRVMTELHSLSYFTDKANFKSYDELKKKFNLIVGAEIAHKTQADVEAEVDQSFARDTAKATKAKPAAESEDDDDLQYFSRLAAAAD